MRNRREFLAEYRSLCERHGLMVIFVVKDDDEYSPFALAKLNVEELEKSLAEMRKEPVRVLVE